MKPFRFPLTNVPATLLTHLVNYSYAEVEIFGVFTLYILNYF